MYIGDFSITGIFWAIIYELLRKPFKLESDNVRKTRGIAHVFLVTDGTLRSRIVTNVDDLYVVIWRIRNWTVLKASTLRNAKSSMLRVRDELFSRSYN